MATCEDPVPVDEVRVLFFGDSFVAGAGDPTALGWVGRVAAAAMPLTAYNLGVRGETSVAVAARWAAEAAPRLATPAPCALVLSVGANDAIADATGTLCVAPATSADTVGRILDEASDAGLSAFVVGPPPVGDDAADARIGDLTVHLAGVCAARDTPFVPVADRLRADPAWRREAAANDGAHPATGGYARLAELVLEGGFIAWLDGVRRGPHPDQRGLIAGRP